jgi:PAS domain S-box-containing protein
MEPRDHAVAVDDAGLAQLVRDLADAVVICDAEGTITFWNQAATTIFGWPAAEVIGGSLDVIIPPRLQARHWAGYREVMETGHTEYGDKLLEVPAQHRDGRPLSIAFTVSLLMASGGTKPVGIAAVIRDDTARWQERRELRARVRELSSADATV